MSVTPWQALIEGTSPAMRGLRDSIAAAARAPDDPVLILGPTGSGKERVAQAIHRSSRRPGSPYVPHVGANYPTELFDSSLVGHARGAFTGAATAMKGACDVAEDGVLFLDEIGDIPLALQPKLLRELFARPGGGSWTFPLSAFEAALAALKARMWELRRASGG